jgi:hypothetical protein
LAWVGEESPSALCLVEATSTGRAPVYQFLEFVSKDMEDLAINKALQQPNQKAGIRTIPKSRVKNFPKEKMPANTAVK